MFPLKIICPEAIVPTKGYAPCVKANQRAILTMTILGSSLAFMDGSIVNVALPTLQKEFQASASSVQWVMQSYTLFCAALLLFSGVLGDRLGRKRIFALGVGLFTISSVGAAAAGSLWVLITWRSLQGIGASLLIPQSLAILSAAFGPEERAGAIGAWSAWASVFTALGPILGGWLIQVLNWRWSFLINLPAAIWIVLLLSKLRESETHMSPASLRKLDLPGTLLYSFGLAALLYALSFAPLLGWNDAGIRWSVLVGVVFLGAFLRSQMRNENALMPTSIFKNLRFSISNVLTFFFYGALAGASYVIPFYAMQIQHLSPFQTGAVFLPCITLMIIFASKVGRLSARYGERVFLVSGTLVSAVGFWLFGFLATRESYATALLPGMVALGAGIALVLAPLTNVVMSSVPEDKASLASAINNSVSRLAGLLVLSALILALVHGFNRSFDENIKAAKLPKTTTTQLLSSRSLMTAIVISEDLSANEKVIAQRSINDAYTSGYALMMYLCALASLLSAIPVVLWWNSANKMGHHRLSN